MISVTDCHKIGEFEKAEGQFDKLCCGTQKYCPDVLLICDGI